MRNAWLVAFLTLPAAACAAGGTGDSLDGSFGNQEAVDSGGGSNPKNDGGGTPYNSDTGTGTGADTGIDKGPGTDSSTPPPDTGPGVTTDTGVHDSASATDASAHDALASDGGAKDAPAADTIVTAACPTTVTDISAGGTFTIDTCTSTTTVAATCGTTAAAVILRGDSPLSGSTYSLTLPSCVDGGSGTCGWVIQMLDNSCAPEAFECGATGTWSVSGATFDPYWYFAIEPASGTCGTTTVTVDRLM
jgi:hypothetical protein